MPEPLDTYGSLEPDPSGWRLTFVRRLAHPPAKVWRAVTEPDHLAAWFPTRIEGERAAGAALRFVFPDGEGPSFEGEMLVFDPPSVLELRWGDDRLRISLEPDADGGTVLTFVDTFAEQGRAARDAAGWHSCLDLLDHDVRGDEAPWTAPERWAEVHGTYVERFGPEASTIGPPSERAEGS
jgi:uncharacterized protein YndB with AHSA1/START domain